MFQINSISKTFPDKNHVLSYISLDLLPGKVYSLIGSNGSGKSTLLKIIAGLTKADSGELNYNGYNLLNNTLTKISNQVHYLYQSREENLSPSLTLKELIALSLTNKKSELYYFNFKSLNEIIYYKLKSLNLHLEEKLNQPVKTLSGGEFQAASILVLSEIIKGNPDIEHLVLFDEHTAHLDNAMTTKVMDLSKSLASENNVTVLIVPHNLNHAIMYSDYILVLKNSKITNCFEKGKATFPNLAELQNLLFP